MATKCNSQGHIAKGLNYLERTCRPITGFQNDCIGASRGDLQPRYFPEDVFTSLNALDLLGDVLSSRCKSILKNFVKLEKSETGTLNFNKYAYVIPDDVEDTSLYHYVFLKDGTLENDKRLVDVARLIYLNTDKNGIIQLYYPPCEQRRRERLEAGCLSNTMRFLYFIGAAEEAEKTEDYLYDWLLSGKYLKGTRYYPSPDTFLFFCSKAVRENERARERFQPHLLQALRQRMGEEKFPLDLAFRIMALNNLDKFDCPEYSEDVKKMVDMLKNMQDETTGAWPKDALFKLGGSDNFLGGQVVATLFSVAALKQFEEASGETQEVQTSGMPI